MGDVAGGVRGVVAGGSNRLDVGCFARQMASMCVTASSECPVVLVGLSRVEGVISGVSSDVDRSHPSSVEARAGASLACIHWLIAVVILRRCIT